MMSDYQPVRCFLCGTTGAEEALVGPDPAVMACADEAACLARSAVVTGAALEAVRGRG
jgi:hypothetical protein